MRLSITQQLREAREKIEHLELRVNRGSVALQSAEEKLEKIAKEVLPYHQVREGASADVIIAHFKDMNNTTRNQINSLVDQIANLQIENAKAWLMVRIMSEKPGAFAPEELSIFKVAMPDELKNMENMAMRDPRY